METGKIDSWLLYPRCDMVEMSTDMHATAKMGQITKKLAVKWITL